MKFLTDLAVVAVASMGLSGCTVLDLSVSGSQGAEEPDTATSIASAFEPHCYVRAENSRGATLIRANLRSSDDLSGTYDLWITQRGPGGTSTVRQGGAFDADGRGVTTLGTARFNSGTHIAARMEVTLADGTQLRCRDFEGRI